MTESCAVPPAIPAPDTNHAPDVSVAGGWVETSGSRTLAAQRTPRASIARTPGQCWRAVPAAPSAAVAGGRATP